MKLTKREEEVADHLAQGHSYKKIAEDMDLTVGTVSNYAHSVYEKIGISGKIPFMMWWRNRKSKREFGNAWD